MTPSVSNQVMSPRILPLSTKAHSQITSSKQITGLQGVVCDLVQNSLDAEATKVEVTVDYRRGGCTVDDNGLGVPPEEFSENGGLGKWHHTSKRDSAIDGCAFSRKGTFLASLSSLSMLTFTSRREHRPESASLTFHQGKIIAREIPAVAPHELVTFPQHGTHVSVTDLFGNIPVRVKQRMFTSKTLRADEKQWQALKHELVATILAWPTPCSIKLRDAESGTRVLTLCVHDYAASCALTARCLGRLSRAPAKPSVEDRLPIIFQAGLAPSDVRRDWVPVSASTPRLSIEGSICLEPAPTKSCQFISLGARPCSTHSGYHLIYESVNKVFANSTFGMIESDTAHDNVEKDRRIRDRRYRADGYMRRQSNCRKGTDRWPAFVLQIQVQESQARAYEPERQKENLLSEISIVLNTTIARWLSAHNHLPRNSGQLKDIPRPSDTLAMRTSSTQFTDQLSGDKRKHKRRNSSQDHEISVEQRMSARIGTKTEIVGREGGSANTAFAWTRVKRSNRAIFEHVRKPRLSTASAALIDQNDEANSVHLELSDDSATGMDHSSSVSVPAVQEVPVIHPSSEDFGNNAEVELWAAEALTIESRNPNQPGIDGEDSPTEWLNPVTKQSLMLNARTGVVIPTMLDAKSTSKVPDLGSAASGHINTTDHLLPSATKPMSLARRATSGPNTADLSLLPEALRDWKTPVFTRREEEEIPSAIVKRPDSKSKASAASALLHQHSAKVGLTKLPRSAIRQARVINQVDSKFVLCAGPNNPLSDSQHTLFLVDQHAASERVLLEELLGQLCQPLDASSPCANLRVNTNCTSAVSTTVLLQSINVEVSHREHTLFATHSARLARWGILYDLHTVEPIPSASQVRAQPTQHRLAVRTLPPGIAERCKSKPQVLFELLRGEIWRLEEAPRTAAASVPHFTRSTLYGGPPSWLAQIGDCPKGILDMLNSRACRSAVMFNDPMSREQCERLLRQLGQCVFPFMCAHGRASAVPLVELGFDDDEQSDLQSLESKSSFLKRSHFDGKECEEDEGFTAALRKWKQCR